MANGQLTVLLRRLFCRSDSVWFSNPGCVSVDTASHKQVQALCVLQYASVKMSHHRSTSPSYAVTSPGQRCGQSTAGQCYYITIIIIILYIIHINVITMIKIHVEAWLCKKRQKKLIENNAVHFLDILMKYKKRYFCNPVWLVYVVAVLLFFLLFFLS